MTECQTCKREYLPRCEGGEFSYSDGSSRVCPNWRKRLDEIGGMTPKQADDQARFDALCR